KDLIVLPSGLKVWPQDVEDVLRADPAVKDAAVLAVPTPGGGARLHAYLVPAPGLAGRGADLATVVARANGVLAQHQRVGTVSWWPEDDFPRTSTLKVRRHLLPLPGGEPLGSDDDVPPIEGDPIAEAVAGAAHVVSVQEGQTLAQLGLDSMGLVELAASLEEKT